MPRILGMRSGGEGEGKAARYEAFDREIVAAAVGACGSLVLGQLRGVQGRTGVRLSW